MPPTLLDTAEATARLRERRGLCAPQRHNAASLAAARSR